MTKPKAPRTAKRKTKVPRFRPVDAAARERRWHWRETFYAAIGGLCAARGAKTPSPGSVPGDIVHDAQDIADAATGGRPSDVGRWDR